MLKIKGCGDLKNAERLRIYSGEVGKVALVFGDNYKLVTATVSASCSKVIGLFMATYQF